MFKPLLAEKVDLETLRYPVLASPKYDGFRCVIDAAGNPMSRNMKPVANTYVFGKLKEMDLPKFDGELLTYTGEKVDDFNTIQSKLSSRNGMPDFKFMVFDTWDRPSDLYFDRNVAVGSWIRDHSHLKRIVHVQQHMIYNEEQLLDFEAKCLAEGWEGVMVRSGYGHYKFGRSTTKEGILLKLKRFFDSEAEVVSCSELLHNANEATTNELGYTERSSHKANMVGMDTLGKFTVKWGDVEFDIGTGFSASQRDEYWRNRDELVGKLLTFKYQSLGPNGKPRFPVFLGFRHDV
jgi:DNA ligase-1